MSRIPGWQAVKARWAAITPRRKALLALLLVFATGLGAGALMEDIVDEIERPFFAADHDDEDDGLTEESLLERLDLTAEQRVQIERAFEAREDGLEAYWDAHLSELESVIDSSRQDIRAVLTPDQRAVYDSQLGRLRLQSRRELEADDDD
jgi:Spy/CpxP family protein refolding chaperone